MADQFTTTTTTGYGKRIVKSFTQVLVGIVLFFGSFVVLFWNEGRVDLSTIAKTSTEIDSSSVSQDTNLEGTLVSTTGIFATEETLGDGLYLIPGNYLAVERKVEMYAWVEETETETTTNVGGSETTETTYNYVKEWTENPKSTGDFEYPEGHENPSLTIEGDSYRVTNATLGAYSVNMSSVDLPSFSPITLTEENVTLDGSPVLGNSTYVYLASSDDVSLSKPEVGDIRVSYFALAPGKDVTIFGELSGSSIVPFVDEEGNRLYRVFDSTRSEAIATLHTEYTTSLWLLRLLGFGMMWFGLMSVFGPINVLLDILPAAGGLSRALVGGVTFLVSLVLSIVTIIVSMVIHNVIVLLIVLLLTAGGFWYYFKRRKAKKSGAAAQA